MGRIAYALLKQDWLVSFGHARTVDPSEIVHIKWIFIVESPERKEP